MSLRESIRRLVGGLGDAGVIRDLDSCGRLMGGDNGVGIKRLRKMEDEEENEK